MTEGFELDGPRFGPARGGRPDALVILAHGDHRYAPQWDALMKRSLTHICGKTGITCGDWAYVEMGQGFASNAAPAIAAAAGQRDRVIVVGCYVSMGVHRLHQRFVRGTAAMARQMARPETKGAAPAAYWPACSGRT